VINSNKDHKFVLFWRGDFEHPKNLGGILDTQNIYLNIQEIREEWHPNIQGRCQIYTLIGVLGISVLQLILLCTERALAKPHFLQKKSSRISCIYSCKLPKPVITFYGMISGRLSTLLKRLGRYLLQVVSSKYARCE